MTYWIRRTALMAVFALLFCLFVLQPSPSHAVWREGCGASTQYRVDWWQRTQTTTALTLDPFDALWRSAKMRHQAGMGYWWCPRGNRPDKVMFDSIRWRSIKLDSNEVPNVRGVKINPFISNHAGNSTDPAGTYMSWPLFAGTWGKRKNHFHNFHNSGWMLRRSSPFWTMSAWVDIMAQPDDHIDFKGLVYGRHYLGYHQDELILK